MKVNKIKNTNPNGEGACGLHCIKIKDISVKVGEQTIIDKVNLHSLWKATVSIGKW